MNERRNEKQKNNYECDNNIVFVVRRSWSFLIICTAATLVYTENAHIYLLWFILLFTYTLHKNTLTNDEIQRKKKKLLEMSNNFTYSRAIRMEY